MIKISETQCYFFRCCNDFKRQYPYRENDEAIERDRPERVKRTTSLV